MLNDKKDAVADVTESLLSKNIPIVRAQQVQQALNEIMNLEVDLKLVRTVLRKDLGMGYRMAKKVPIQCNLERTLVLRQQYSIKMLPMLEQRKRVINVDESWLNQTRFLRRTWVPSQSASTFRDKQVHPRISLILALDTDGKMYFALTQANTDADIMTLFLRNLM